jgi:hypothetical protein
MMRVVGCMVAGGRLVTLVNGSPWYVIVLDVGSGLVADVLMVENCELSRESISLLIEPSSVGSGSKRPRKAPR